MDPVIYASEGDSFVYKSDLKLLEPGNWLNDNLLTFYLTCLPSPSHTLLDSAVLSFLINQLHEDDEDFVEECIQMKDTFIGNNSNFLLVVNSSYVGRECFGKVGGGVHWSLLHVIINNGVKDDESSSKGKQLIVTSSFRIPMMIN
ncbi:hypothetical protein TL16_g01254 [Triparma laevis f. inornata]|uniref:Ubiquitin-like protease family profile domain-containing protein n=2 Tax=Triparma laevis TaxID=1534972 RepID=A0A9W7L0Q6_9STRA|nr:hypothetical protein TL16_g01254 [Triparma laevis f. inornata]GMI18304.1 hypothetical protein TrLO_g2795 [Triparma laevis f. longispina]